MYKSSMVVDKGLAQVQLAFVGKASIVNGFSEDNTMTVSRIK